MYYQPINAQGRLTVCPMCDANLDLHGLTTQVSREQVEVECARCGFTKTYRTKREEAK